MNFLKCLKILIVKLLALSSGTGFFPGAFPYAEPGGQDPAIVELLAGLFCSFISERFFCSALLFPLSVGLSSYISEHVTFTALCPL